MNKKTKQTFKLTVLAAAVLAAYGPAFAEGPESSVSVGVGNWSNDRPQRGTFDGMRDSGGYLLLDADVLKRDDATGTWWGLSTRNLGLDNREIKAEWQRQGDIGASLEYSRIPRDNPWTFNTGVTGIGTDTLRVPTTGIASGSGANVELGTVRDRTTVKFFKSLGEGLKFNVSFRNDDKDGTRQWGRGGAPEFAVEPISSTIRQLEATLSYARDRLQLSGGYYGTSYKNDYSLITTSLASLASPYYLSQPMDNKGHEVFVNGGYNFTPTTRGTFKVSYSKVTQDEHLPTADITGLASALSPKNLSGRLDTTLVEAGLTARPMPDLSIAANLRHRNFADKTPIFGVVFSTSSPFPATVYNTPFSYKNNVGKLEATYRLSQGYSLLGGIEINNQDRWVPTLGTLYVPFRAKQDETTYRIQLRKSMSETVNGSIAYAHSKRDGGSYRLPGDTYEDRVNPLNIANRKRDKWRAMLDWSPMDKLSLQFVIEDSRDKYSGLEFGLQNGKGKLYSVDANYRVSEDWQIHAWYSRDETKSREITEREAAAASTSTTSATALSDFAEADKFNELSEKGDSIGVGVRGMAFGKLKIGADLEQFRSVNKYQQSLTLQSAGNAYPFLLNATSTTVTPGLPDITNKMLRLKLFAQYPIQKNADLRFNLIYERWRTDDWSWTMFPATGAAPFSYNGGGSTGTATTDGTTVTQNPKQSSTFAGIRYIYRFE
ncbi:MAG: hypothetical protein A2W21_08305 [Betaproteobacteria bacterium RBG_16_66_20]|nr:MAG: hypothetical protein A2W21_08305 [Betaproteobacteria bacterium RBG_16_66_20]